MVGMPLHVHPPSHIYGASGAGLEASPSYGRQVRQVRVLLVHTPSAGMQSECPRVIVGASLHIFI